MWQEGIAMLKSVMGQLLILETDLLDNQKSIKTDFLDNQKSISVTIVLLLLL